MAQYRIDEADRIRLQYNAIRSHASGSGQPVDPLYVRSVLIVLLNNFFTGTFRNSSRGSGINCAMINHGITPMVPEHGGVGASGDLVQLAHVALALIGEGEVYCDGALVDTGKAFRQYNLKPFRFTCVKDCP